MNPANDALLDSLAQICLVGEGFRAGVDVLAKALRDGQCRPDTIQRLTQEAITAAQVVKLSKFPEFQGVSQAAIKFLLNNFPQNPPWAKDVLLNDKKPKGWGDFVRRAAIDIYRAGNFVAGMQVFSQALAANQVTIATVDQAKQAAAAAKPQQMAQSANAHAATVRAQYQAIFDFTHMDPRLAANAQAVRDAFGQWMESNKENYADVSPRDCFAAFLTSNAYATLEKTLQKMDGVPIQLMSLSELEAAVPTPPPTGTPRKLQIVLGQDAFTLPEKTGRFGMTGAAWATDWEDRINPDDTTPFAEHLSMDHTQGPAVAASSVSGAIHREKAHLPDAMREVLGSCRMVMKDGQAVSITEKYPDLHRNGYLQPDVITEPQDLAQFAEDLKNPAIIGKMTLLAQPVITQGSPDPQIQFGFFAPSFQGVFPFDQVRPNHYDPAIQEYLGKHPEKEEAIRSALEGVDVWNGGMDGIPDDVLPKEVKEKLKVRCQSYESICKSVLGPQYKAYGKCAVLNAAQHSGQKIVVNVPAVGQGVFSNPPSAFAYGLALFSQEISGHDSIVPCLHAFKQSDVQKWCPQVGHLATQEGIQADSWNP